MQTTSRRELIVPGVRCAAIVMFLVLSAGARMSNTGQDEGCFVVTAEPP